MYTDDLITVTLVVQYLFDGKGYYLCDFSEICERHCKNSLSIGSYLDNNCQV